MHTLCMQMFNLCNSIQMGKFDHNNQMITFSVIILSSSNCTFKIISRHYLLCSLKSLGPLVSISIIVVPTSFNIFIMLCLFQLTIFHFFHTYEAGFICQLSSNYNLSCYMQQCTINFQ
jgi:hypothetical protein